MIPAWLIATSVGLNIYGQYTSNKAEAEALKRNAKQINDEIRQTRRVAAKEQEIVSQEYDTAITDQQNIFVRAGVRMEGSPLNLLIQENMKKHGELLDISTQADEEITALRLQAGEMRNQASQLTSFKYNAIGAASSLLSGATTYMANKPTPKPTGGFIYVPSDVNTSRA